MVINISTKYRITLIMVISQIGFITISAFALFSDKKTWGIIALNVFFAILVAYLSYKSIQRVVGGIARLEEYLQNLMEFVFFKTNYIRVAEYIKNDEIGYILKELNQYVQQFDKTRKDDMHIMGEIVIALDKVSQGIYTARISATTTNPMIHTLKTIVNNMLERTNKNIEDLGQIVGLYTEQDYTKQIQIDPIIKGRMLFTMERINQLGTELNSNAKQNLENGNLLESTSIQMSKSVDNLAHRANEQAASLEETAAALEEITSITKNNTENALKMASLSKDVRDSVTLGEDLANKTASSMDEINSEVKAINEAISVIDNIAFQTNILSLNAAVEAATAGEAGKGFAVVAGEVRNLASRSAQAAKEIKDLVEKASHKTDEGKKISDEMIKGYKNLNSQIIETLEIIQNVSVASNEQLKGIEQINRAISTLDKATQENAAEASNVSLISEQTLKMAQILVQDAKTKKVS
ncbi:MCP-domain signal transduction protein [Aliarcobacter cibarius]|uniref:MCP-domain signal transduction protein n=1 Tax=Aliarcobacter cibarius TaxID=255507 RepID=A0A7L5JLW4_9BACT|nr:methyl-accepting chemotaxis protein [Aliarcobacter cibarius]QKJ26205.1 MCP-domain signal transduction protein [Aliarcobacter cibarius]